MHLTVRIDMPSTHSILMNQQIALKKEGKRRCCYCKDVFPLTKEHFRLTFNSTLFARACKGCERKKALKRHHERMKTRDLPTAIRYKLYQAKYRSKNKRAFKLTTDDVQNQWDKQQGKCFYTGQTMSVALHELNSFSIDRYDSSLGYHPNNIVLCSNAVNLMKKDMSEKDFKSLCQAIVDYRRPESLGHIPSDTTHPPDHHQKLS